MMEVEKNIKIVVVGDGGVGKTCLLLRYVTDEMPKDYVPTTFENHTQPMMFEGKEVQANLWDTAGQEDLSSLRTMAYAHCNIYILCFSIDSTISLDNVQDKWIDELKKYSPETAVLLVGLKSDIRDDPDLVRQLADKNKSPVTYDDGKIMAKNIKAVDYMECSAQKNIGVESVFQRALQAVMRGEGKENETKTKKKLKCAII